MTKFVKRLVFLIFIARFSTFSVFKSRVSRAQVYLDLPSRPKLSMKKLTIPAVLITFFLYQFIISPGVDARTPTADQDFDVNLRVRGWGTASTITEPSSSPYNVLIDVGGDTDAQAPQLSTLFGGVNLSPAIGELFQVKNPGGSPVTIDNTGNWGVTLMELSGDQVLVPQSGYEIGEGYQATVLYASSSDLTLKYTAEDDVVYGYTIALATPR